MSGVRGSMALARIALNVSHLLKHRYRCSRSSTLRAPGQRLPGRQALCVVSARCAKLEMLTRVEYTP